MFTAILFISDNRIKMTKMPYCKQIVQLWHILTMGYYLMMKKNKLLIPVTTQIDLKFHFITFLNKHFYRDGEKNCGLQRLGIGIRVWKCGYKVAVQDFLIAIEQFCILSLVAVIQSYICDKIAQNYAYIHIHTWVLIYFVKS